MEKEIKKKYRVLNPIGYDGRKERGEIVIMTEAEAKNIGDHYLEEVKVEERGSVEISDEGAASGEYDETEEEENTDTEESEESEETEEEVKVEETIEEKSEEKKPQKNQNKNSKSNKNKK